MNREDDQKAIKLEQARKSLFALKESWGSAIVARAEVARFSGGTLNPGSMSNFDYQGQGPEDAFLIGRKKVYPIESLIKWMIQRVVIQGGRHGH